MSTFNVPDLLADIAQLSNAAPFTAGTNVTVSRATYWIAQSARSLSALLRQKHPEDREFLQVDVQTTLPGFKLSSLPSDCGEVHAVVWRRASDDYVLLQSADATDLAKAPLELGKSWRDEDEEDPRWRLEGHAVALYPPSGVTETLEVFFTSQLSPTSGSFTARVDFDRWVTLDVCAKVATKRRRDPGQFLRDKALLENDLLTRSRKRDVLETHTIRDRRHEQRMHYIRSRY